MKQHKFVSELNELGFEPVSNSHGKTSNENAIDFVKQMQDTFQPDRIDLKSNFNTSYCDSVIYLLNFHKR